MKSTNNPSKSYFRKFWLGLKIRHKLVLVFLPISVFTLILMGSLWYRNALSAVEKTLEDQAGDLARSISQQVEEFFLERQVEINSVAELPWIKSFFLEINEKKSPAWHGKYEQLFKKLLIRLDGGYFQITCFDLQKRALAKVQLTSLLPSDELPAHFETSVFDAQDMLEIQDLNSLVERKMYIPEVKSIRGAKTLVFEIAVYNAKAGLQIGALAFCLPLSEVAGRVIKGSSLGLASQTLVVDRKADLIYHSDRKKTNQNLLAAMPWLGSAIAPIRGMQQGTKRYDDGEEKAWIISYAPAPRIQWNVGVASPLEPFIRSTKRAGLTGIGITLGFSVVLLLLIHLFSRNFARDLSEVAQGARAIAAGELDRQIPVRTSDEIGWLAEDFNRMAADLRRLLHERRANETLIAIGRFSAALAHDLRNPVEGLKLLSLELCKRVAPGRLEHEIADTIAQSVNNLSSLVNQSLDFARLNQPCFSATDLAALADEVLKDFCLDEVDLKRTYARQLPLVEVDVAQIKRVLANLIRNAVEAGLSQKEAKRCQLHVTLRALGERVRIKVSDNGPGIPAEIRERIFEPFFSTKPGGHGLGLALVKQIIANHSGTITFNSVAGEGTRFVVALPMSQTIMAKGAISGTTLVA
ncbi:MAG: ATP-binding protein [bacterium]